MATRRRATEPHSEGHASDETAKSDGQEPPGPLRHLAGLVNARGIRTSIIHRVGLRLYGHRPDPFPRSDRFELVAHSRDGWEVATVIVGDHSGYFMVSLPTVAIGCQPINADQPHAVVDLILAALPKETA